MHRLELEEYKSYSTNIPLNKDQLRALTEDARIDVTPSSDEDGAYILKPSSHVGAVNIGEFTVVVRPKVPIDRVMFLIAYAMDPKNWRTDSVELTRDDDILEAVTLAFAHRTRQAIQRGLLQGYRREDVALNTVRGRIRFGDQIGQHFDIPLPVEVAFDEFTEDIEKNRLLKTAIHRLGHTFIRSEAARLEVRRLRPAFTMVETRLIPARGAARSPLHQAGRALPPRRGTGASHHRKLQSGTSSRQGHRRRLSHRHEQGIRAVPLRSAGGGALPARTPMETGGGAHTRRGPPHLDESRTCHGGLRVQQRTGLGPSSSATRSTRSLSRSDPRTPTSIRCSPTARRPICPRACWSTPPMSANQRTYKIRHAGKTIEVASLDLRGTPEDILNEVRCLADRVKAHAQASPQALPAA